jgi:YceI-like domain
MCSHRQRRFSSRVSLVVVAAGIVGSAHAGAGPRPINVEQSTLTVFAYKSGLFSAFADNHIIKAPIASGSISEDPPLKVDLTVRAADLRVLDPTLAADRRAEVQARMLGPEVLDAPRFPEITFASTTVEPSGTDRWNVTGRLTIHGQTRTITFAVSRVNGRFHGDVPIKQRDFGIEPIRIAAGAVKVKDELKVQFDVQD